MKTPAPFDARLNLVLNGDQEAVVLVSGQAVVQSHNVVLSHLLGLDSTDLTGRKLEDLFADPVEAAEFRDLLRWGLESRPIVESDVRLSGVGNRVVTLAVRAFPMSGATASGYVLVGHSTGVVKESHCDIQSLALFPQEDPNPVLRISADGVLQYANKGSWMLLAHWRTDIGGQVPLTWIDMIRQAIDCGEVRELEVEVGFKTIHLVIVPIAEKGYVNLYGLDVTRRRYVEDKLKVNAQVFENATEGIMISDPDLRIVDVNNAFCRITGYSREEILGEHASILYSERHDKRFYDDLWKTAMRTGSWQGEVWDRRRNGEIYPKWLSVSAVTGEDGSVRRFIVIFSDITTLKRTEEQLYQMAHYDSLTGLANRRYFLEILKGALLAASRSQGIAALMFIDLDGFKLVNDTLGHSAGDHLLKEVAARIRECLRVTDTVARIGGDEFTVILPSLKDVQDAGPVARKVLSRVGEPLQLGNREVLVTPSIGISVYPNDGIHPDTLIQCADTAMYRAKESGKNGYQFFSPDMNERAEERLVLLSKLKRAVRNQEFLVHYQPQIRLSDGALTGVEALIRWNSNEHGIVGPSCFVQTAEEHGLISEIGDLVLREVCRQGRAWIDDELSGFRIAVNISAHQIRRNDFVADFEAVLDENGLPPQMIEIELTERVMVEDDRNTKRTLERLKSLGCSLVIDDFGTKYSSLAYLKRFPIDRLKIDQAFVRDLRGPASDDGIASVIVAMGRSLRMDVIAEGVETQAQAQCLKALDCPHAQGFYFGRPGPPEEMTRLLRKKLGADRQ